MVEVGKVHCRLARRGLQAGSALTEYLAGPEAPSPFAPVGVHYAWMQLLSPSTGRRREQNTIPWIATGARQGRLSSIRPLPALVKSLGVVEFRERDWGQFIRQRARR